MDAEYPQDIIRQTSISGHLVLFSRFLRSRGYTLSLLDEADALKGLQAIGIRSARSYFMVLRTIYANNPWQYAEFEGLYREFLYELKRAYNDKVKKQYHRSTQKKPSRQRSLEALKDWLFNRPAQEESVMGSYDPIESLVYKDFSMMTPDEVTYILRLLETLARRLKHRKSRLNKRSVKRRRLDIRMTMRSNFRRGSEVGRWIYSERKPKKMRIVLLCDVSRSMDLYSRFFIQMLYAFQTGYDRIHTFVFSTALFDITAILAHHNFNRAFEIIGQRIPQWSGGTRIGNCLQNFIDENGYSMLNRKTTVLILSDGWDTGSPGLLGDAMRRINKSSRKVIWLNPLAGNPSYEPDTMGMVEALPYIDVFAPVHNLESLRKAMKAL